MNDATTRKTGASSGAPNRPGAMAPNRIVMSARSWATTDIDRCRGTPTYRSRQLLIDTVRDRSARSSTARNSTGRCEQPIGELAEARRAPGTSTSEALGAIEPTPAPTRSATACQTAARGLSKYQSATEGRWP